MIAKIIGVLTLLVSLVLNIVALVYYDKYHRNKNDNTYNIAFICNLISISLTFIALIALLYL